MATFRNIYTSFFPSTVTDEYSVPVRVIQNEYPVPKISTRSGTNFNIGMLRSLNYFRIVQQSAPKNLRIIKRLMNIHTLTS